MRSKPSCAVLLTLAIAAPCAHALNARGSIHRNRHRERRPRIPEPAAVMLPEADAQGVARALGYVVGVGSLLLYTPIAVRVVRQGNADGLTLQTWWLKFAAYAASDIYCITQGYPISTFVETLIITVEAAILLVLVASYQRRLDGTFFMLSLSFVATATWALTVAPTEALAFAQAASTLLNTAALLPQINLNAQRGEAGDYSPVTSALACSGCLIRIFTTTQLAGSDPLLLGGFLSGLALNCALLGQIVYYGSVKKGRPLLAVLASDFVGSTREDGGDGSDADALVDEEMSKRIR